MLIVFIRALILYAMIVFALRLMGKRQLGELQPSELVTTILVSNIATLPIEDQDIPMLMGIVPVLTLVSLDVLLSAAVLKSRRLRGIMSGNPRVIVRDGIIDQKELKNLRYTIDDLMEALRDYAIFDVREVQFAIVETTGKINVYQKYAARTVTAKMLELNAPDGNPPAVIISDGELIRDNLSHCGLSEEWVRHILRQNQVGLTQVFLMTADTGGEYHLVRKEAGQ